MAKITTSISLINTYCSRAESLITSGRVREAQKLIYSMPIMAYNDLITLSHNNERYDSLFKALEVGQNISAEEIDKRLHNNSLNINY